MAKIISTEAVRGRFGNLPGGGSMQRCTLESDILGTEKTFTVYLPAGYDEGSRRYPVLYLFHPAGTTDLGWAEMGEVKNILDDAIRSGMALPMIVVTPDASGYGDNYAGKRLGYFSVTDWDYEEYFNSELMPLVDSSFRTLADKHHRAIAGPSMAGEAAIAYAQKHPELYSSAGALSGILGKPEQSKMARTDKDYGQSLIDNDPSKFVAAADEATVERLKTVRWYADCGDNDFFYEGNILYFLAMKSRGIPMDYRMRSGAHSWHYWISGLGPLLHFISIGFA